MISRTSIVAIVSACVLLMASLPVLAQFEPRMISCSKIKSDNVRLSCYDRLAKQITEAGEKSAKSEEKAHYIQPPEEFLRSQLRTNPEKSDFDLTIDQFIQLIKSAKMENGQPVVIVGWSKQGRGYVLNIRMKSPLQLVFMFEPDKHSDFSVLQPVLIKGVKVDPALFVMNMAARTM